jgi:hypothetical protein
MDDPVIGAISIVVPPRPAEIPIISALSVVLHALNAPNAAVAS